MQIRVVNKGQSLIEVVIAVAVAAIALGALLSMATTSIKNAQFARDQIQADKYAQQGIEWVRLEKVKSWTDFNSHIGNTYCINTLDWNTTGNCGPFLANVFKRELTLVDQGNCPTDNINAIVRVYWTDSSGTHNKDRETCFTDWK